MTQITINIPNENDSSWILQLLNRLHLDFKISNEKAISDSEKTELEKNQAIIAKGSSMSIAEADQMLDWVKESRQDRKLPFRD